MSLVMDKYDALEEEHNLKYFSFLFGFSQFVGALAVILAAVWMGSFGNGFAWSEVAEKQFNYHPLFMTIGLIFLYGEAILVYRVFRHEQKRFTKLLHMVLHMMIFVFFVVALKAVFDSHNYARDGPKPNMYTLHSWVGMSTVLLFCSQFLCGFLAFFFPGWALPRRSWYLPIHQFFGLLIFVMAIMSALMGISERAAWHINDWDQFSAQGMTANFLGISILVYGGTVLFLVGNPRYRRKALPQEESLQQLAQDFN